MTQPSEMEIAKAREIVEPFCKLKINGARSIDLEKAIARALHDAAKMKAELLEAAQDVATTNGEDIPGLDYLILYVDRKAWARLKAALEKLEATDAK